MNGGIRVEVVRAATAELAVHHLGPPHGPLWALAHGVGSSSTFVLEAFGPPILQAGGRLAAIDLRGHGASTPCRDPAEHAHAHHVEDLLAVAETLRPEVLGGVSLGGHAAVGAVCAGADVRACVACLPAWTGRAVPGEGPHAAVADQVRRLGVPALVEEFRRDTEMVPWLREVLVRDWPRHDPDALAAALVALDGARAPTLAEIADLPCPLAVVGWPDDPGHPLEVARQWVEAADGVLGQLRLEDMQGDRTALGRAAVAAVAELAG